MHKQIDVLASHEAKGHSLSPDEEKFLHSNMKAWLSSLGYLLEDMSIQLLFRKAVHDLELLKAQSDDQKSKIDISYYEWRHKALAYKRQILFRYRHVQVTMAAKRAENHNEQSHD